MIFRRYTFWLTLVAIAACLLNYFGYDRDNVLFYFISFPSWIYEVLFDIHNVHVFLVYSTTIVFWFLLGFFLDRAIRRREQERASER